MVFPTRLGLRNILPCTVEHLCLRNGSRLQFMLTVSALYFYSGFLCSWGVEGIHSFAAVESVIMVLNERLIG